MINSELAQKLKDAGFPQNYPTGEHNAVGQKYWMYDKSDNDYTEITHDGCGSNALDDEQLTLIPTLSELIEECGDRFTKLKKHISKKGEISWFAGGLEPKGWWRPYRNYKMGWAKTPEEAVANLYLEINKS